MTDSGKLCTILLVIVGLAIFVKFFQYFVAVLLIVGVVWVILANMSTNVKAPTQTKEERKVKPQPPTTSSNHSRKKVTNMAPVRIEVKEQDENQFVESP